MKKLIILLSLGALTFGCATTGSNNAGSSAGASAAPADNRECAANFTYDGSFISGRTFKTFALVKGVTKATAMQRAAQFTVANGFTISDSNTQLGVISATQQVSHGKGKVAPLNITFQPTGKDLKVTMSYSISGGVTSPVDAVRNHFCGTIEAMQGK